MSSFASGKFALRATGQSLAREFGPKGVHVAHAIIDGVIDIPRTKNWPVNGGADDGKISSDAVSYQFLLHHIAIMRRRRRVIMPSRSSKWNRLLTVFSRLPILTGIYTHNRGLTSLKNSMFALTLRSFS
jgi:hypothetical protein